MVQVRLSLRHHWLDELKMKQNRHDKVWGSRLTPCPVSRGNSGGRVVIGHGSGITVVTGGGRTRGLLSPHERGAVGIMGAIQISKGVSELVHHVSHLMNAGSKRFR